MKDSVLFVNRDQAEIKEFLNAMQDYTFEIDTADSGLEAAVLLRKKSYKVVITGMNLSTYDGMKLLAYLNGHCPYTACIVYTTRIDLAQLRVLVNQREVFRIFLKPVNYRGDFYNAIKDGFAYYDIREAEMEEQKILEQKQRNREDTEVQEVESPDKIEWNQMKSFIRSLVPLSVENFDISLSEEERQILTTYEQTILDYYLQEEYEACDSLEMLKARIKQEFVLNEQQQVVIETNQKLVNSKPGFYEQLHFMIWLLLTQIAEISDTYSVKIEMDFQIPFRPMIRIQASTSREEWKRYKEKKICRERTKVVTSIMESFAERYKMEITEDSIIYQVQMRTEERKKVK
ncbi:response regulator [Roseburia sp. 499]|uniref:response regulator n=1 Tax=Roseburia sp. 499 TaxID=1261634 RepID=UPI000952C1AC|nr:response regulator [Roseburia sp. 499]WVK70344.1 response regulator [Roseburia sp. 499]